MKILIADDNTTDRIILSRVLENLGHEVIQALDGALAVSQFTEHDPDLVLLDVLMPGYDGYEVAEIIKEQSNRAWFPIIFLTSLTEASDLARCIDAGGDDFVSKPINKIIIKAKIDAFERIINLYRTVAEQQEKIAFHNEHLIQEQEAAKRIFNNIAHRGCLESENINYHLSPMSIFNGDLMLAAERPMGGMRLLLADFTGHGLPAAIGAMPASEIFYGMTLKGFSIPDLMVEMNKRLYGVLPRGIFCCVIVIDIDTRDQTLTIWNAGAPDSYLINTETGTFESISSTHLPLGIQSPEKFEVLCKGYEFTPSHKLIAVTDGIIEAEDANGQMFGEDRLLQIIKKELCEENICEALIKDVDEFCGRKEQTDDVSLLEVSLPSITAEEGVSNSSQGNQLSGTSDSALCLRLRGPSLANFDPIPMVMQTLLTCSNLQPHRARVFTVLSELYNNALDHGVLGLDSQMKSSTSGFANYYKKRAQDLESLEGGFVDVSVDHQPTETGGKLTFELTDSGSGFDVERLLKEGIKDYSGRGLPLLLNLCDSIDYLDGGSRVIACYIWSFDEELD
ncbi:MAG: fused response regulator/phosphatase [Kangiellaceae bacterium]|nr:fused response regulator/phosphatase [Kangiellaceae bacterium]